MAESGLLTYEANAIFEPFKHRSVWGPAQ
jgi:hypothetical protein